MAPTGSSGTVAAPVREKPCPGGGLFAEDPHLDARGARPAWRIGARPVTALVTHDDHSAQALDLWRIPGRKSLVHDGERQWLYGEAGSELVALTPSPDLQNGAPFAYAVPAAFEPARSGASRVGNVMIITCRPRWASYPYTNMIT